MSQTGKWYRPVTIRHGSSPLWRPVTDRVYWTTLTWARGVHIKSGVKVYVLWIPLTQLLFTGTCNQSLFFRSTYYHPPGNSQVSPCSPSSLGVGYCLGRSCPGGRGKSNNYFVHVICQTQPFSTFLDESCESQM